MPHLYGDYLMMNHRWYKWLLLVLGISYTSLGLILLDVQIISLALGIIIITTGLSSYFGFIIFLEEEIKMEGMANESSIE